ncbi:hypothetical protein [Myceligenerans crystallogenes]|uniref:Transmembrane transport protein n=1 Tax=Myceligenerans crystallogenes TaxID=316335 RepID=A0ABN2NMM6_9MICO
MTDEEPLVTPSELVAGLDRTLSVRARVRAVAALVLGLAGAVFIGALWWTEPGRLPVLTQVTFGLCAVFCLAWAGYGTWLLRSRVPLFATDRVVAAWISLAASGLVGAVLVAMVVRRGSGPWGAVAVAAAFVAVAIVLVVRAHARRAALLGRERELAVRVPDDGA